MKRIILAAACFFGITSMAHASSLQYVITNYGEFGEATVVFKTENHEKVEKVDTGSFAIGGFNYNNANNEELHVTADHDTCKLDESYDTITYLRDKEYHLVGLLVDVGACRPETVYMTFSGEKLSPADKKLLKLKK